MFGLTEQMRSAARSVPANIAEGCGRASRRDFARVLDMASGSVAELTYYFELSRDLGFLSEDEAKALLDAANRVWRMLAGLIRTVRSSP